jgi:hypothetical protein
MEPAAGSSMPVGTASQLDGARHEQISELAARQASVRASCQHALHHPGASRLQLAQQHAAPYTPPTPPRALPAEQPITI